MSAVEFGNEDFAKYPFLNQAGKYLKELGYTLDEFDDSKSKIIERAMRRIQVALEGEVFTELKDVDTEVISFLLSLIILHLLGIKSASKKFALREAMRAENFLVQDLKYEKDDVKDAILKGIFSELFSLNVIQEGKIFKVKVVDYLKRASYFHDKHWKLVNRVVHKGYVYLEPHEVVRLIREELSILIQERINNMEVRQVPESIKKRVEELRNTIMKDRRYGIIQYVRKYPPCIDHILQLLAKGENPSHTSRFLLATYMLAIGKNVDEVCSLFEPAPDYNERITRYQVEYLAGMRGNRKRYNCPSCEKIASEKLCYKTEECNGITTPLHFRSKKEDSNERRKPESS